MRDFVDFVLLNRTFNRQEIDAGLDKLPDSKKRQPEG